MAPVINSGLKDVVCLKKMLDDRVLKRVEKEDREIFEDFKFCHSFADSTHSLLWAWGEEFLYSFKRIGDVLLIAGIGLDQKLSFYLVKKAGSFRDALVYLEELSRRYQFPVIIENVPEKDLFEITDYFLEKGTLRVSHDRDFSDYIYECSEFCSFSGKKNRHKREDRNYLKKNFPGIFYVPFDESLRGEIERIFDEWCESYDCSYCVYGCEKRAFLRLMELYGTGDLICGMSCLEKEFLSFAVMEKISRDTIACYMQKNKRKIRGLMCYLNYRMISGKTGMYLNLGEDMGLPGLRMDKTECVPTFLKHKYRIEQEEQV